MSGPISLRGKSTDRAAYGADDRADLIDFDEQEVGARVFAILCCASPFIIFGVSYIVIRFFA